jgi:alpha-beta hydrolase superfamily lysophospholipase
LARSQLPRPLPTSPVMCTAAGIHPPPVETIGRTGVLGLRRWRAIEPWAVVVLARPAEGQTHSDVRTASRLAAEGLEVVTAGYPSSHARSTQTSTTSVTPMIEDLEAVLNSVLSELPDLPIVLMGHSFGGILAMHVAERRSQDLDALVLSGTTIGASTERGAPAPPTSASGSRGRRLGSGHCAAHSVREQSTVYRGTLWRRRLERTVACRPYRDEAPRLGPLPTLWLLGGETAPGLGPEQSDRQDPVLGEIVVFLQRALRWEHMLR